MPSSQLGCMFIFSFPLGFVHKKRFNRKEDKNITFGRMGSIAVCRSKVHDSIPGRHIGMSSTRLWGHEFQRKRSKKKVWLVNGKKEPDKEKKVKEAL